MNICNVSRGEPRLDVHVNELVVGEAVLSFDPEAELKGEAPVFEDKAVR